MPGRHVVDSGSLLSISATAVRPVEELARELVPRVARESVVEMVRALAAVLELELVPMVALAPAEALVSELAEVLVRELVPKAALALAAEMVQAPAAL